MTNLTNKTTEHRQIATFNGTWVKVVFNSYNKQFVRTWNKMKQKWCVQDFFVVVLLTFRTLF